MKGREAEPETQKKERRANCRNELSKIFVFHRKEAFAPPVGNRSWRTRVHASEIENELEVTRGRLRELVRAEEELNDRGALRSGPGRTKLGKN